MTSIDVSKLRSFKNELLLIAKGMNTSAAFFRYKQQCRDIISMYSDIFPVECGQLSLLVDLWNKGACDKGTCLVQTEKVILYMEEHFLETYKSPRVFISHSTNDVAIVEKLVTVLEQIGIKQSQLFCSSIASYAIPQGAGDIYDYIRNEMNNNNMFFIMMLSQNYYNSPICLNEMGAAWVKQSNYQSILLPGFQFQEIKGAVNPRDICFSLSDVRNRNYALNDLKTRIVTHLGLEEIDHNLWERFRDKFTEEVDRIAAEPTSGI